MDGRTRSTVLQLTLSPDRRASASLSLAMKTWGSNMCRACSLGSDTLADPGTEYHKPSPPARTSPTGTSTDTQGAAGGLLGAVVLCGEDAQGQRLPHSHGDPPSRHDLPFAEPVPPPGQSRTEKRFQGAAAAQPPSEKDGESCPARPRPPANPAGTPRPDQPTRYPRCSTTLHAPENGRAGTTPAGSTATLRIVGGAAVWWRFSQLG